MLGLKEKSLKYPGLFASESGDVLLMLLNDDKQIRLTATVKGSRIKEGFELKGGGRVLQPCVGRDGGIEKEEPERLHKQSSVTEDFTSV